MPWQDVKPMDQKILFIADYLRGAGVSFSDLCQRYSISRKTGYKWINRYRDQGADGLEEQSRRPRTSPLAIPYAVCKEIVAIRTGYRFKPGPKKIQAKLKQRFPSQEPPSLTSIYNVLKREGLVQPRRRRARVPAYPNPFQKVEAANDLWTVDFKGQFRMGDGRWCYPLTVMDHHSRYLLGCQGLKGTGTTDSRKVFRRLFEEYGLPQRIRSDNGVPFASKAAGGLSRLSIWWVKLGILPERIQPGKPQQNGQHERMHRTLKQVVTTPTSPTMAAQQRQLDQFRYEYNEERPHEALGLELPISHYRASPRPYPSRLPELVYPDYCNVLKVRQSGVVYWSGGQVYVSHLLAGEHVGMEEVDDGIWDVYFGELRLGGFDQHKVGGRNGRSYWSLRV